MALTLAIDMGTTNLKVGIVNEKGEILSNYSSALKTFSGEPGEAEHDPRVLKEEVINLCKKVLRDCRNEQVNYIAFSSYHFGLLMMDENRNPITGITLLTDTRSQVTFSDFVALYANDDLYEKTGCPLISQYILPRLYYFSKVKNNLFRKAKYFHDSKSFLFEWMTGEWKTDISTATATQIFNIRDFQWDQNILSKIGLSGDQFPTPIDGTSFMAPLKKEIGVVLGFKNTPNVLLGVYDGAALGIGLTGLRPDVGLINLGTSAMLRVPDPQPVFDKSENKRIQAYALHTKTFLNGGALNNAALPLDWIKNSLFDFDTRDSSLLQISNEPPLISLPYLTGERDSKIGPFASGVFFGMRRTHSRTDFIRSVLEGVAYSLRFIYEALNENELQMKEVRMGGGGVNIKVWPQIFADVLGLPIVIPSVKEPALVGNSMLAFVAAKQFKDLNDASVDMLKKGDCIEPNLNALEIRNRHYQFFKRLRETLGHLFEAHADLRL